jgi:hypothetical protein
VLVLCQGHCRSQQLTAAHVLPLAPLLPVLPPKPLRCGARPCQAAPLLRAAPDTRCPPLALPSQELEHQGQLLDELDEDIDTTHSRLKAAQKKMLDVLKKSGSTTQLAVIGFLIVVLIILVVFAFY